MAAPMRFSSNTRFQQNGGRVPNNQIQSNHRNFIQNQRLNPSQFHSQQQPNNLSFANDPIRPHQPTRSQNQNSSFLPPNNSFGNDKHFEYQSMPPREIGRASIPWQHPRNPQPNLNNAGLPSMNILNWPEQNQMQPTVVNPVHGFPPVHQQQPNPRNMDPQVPHTPQQVATNPPPGFLVNPTFKQDSSVQNLHSHQQIGFNQTVQNTFRPPNSQNDFQKVDENQSVQHFPSHNISKQPFVPESNSFQEQHFSPHPETVVQGDQPQETEEMMDKRWISDWLKTIGKTTSKPCQTPKQNNTLSIHSAQDKIRRMIVLKDQLQKRTKLLNNKIKDLDNQWNKEKEKVISIKKELEQLHAEMTNQKNIRELQKKIKQRRTKRERVKRRNKEIYEEKLEMLERREDKHRQIDRFQEKILQEQRTRKEEKELKESADKILNEVRKKISDASKTMELMKNLQKLRNLRKDRLQQQGVFTNPENDEKFEKVISEQYELLSKQNDVYLTEERALKVMLETEHEENKEKEREELRKKMLLKEERKRKRESEMLFGKQNQIDQDDLLFQHFQYYNQSETSFESFIQIRNNWDMYLVTPATPGASRIPDGWVIPITPTSEKWASALKE